MADDRESFVVWIERGDADDGRARGGAVEWVRMSDRVSFETYDELARFIESCLTRPPVEPAGDAARWRSSQLGKQSR